MARTLLPIAFVVAFACLASAQVARPQESLGFIYNRESAFSLRIHTNRGIQPGIEWGRLRTYYKTTLFSLNISELKHPKEQRQSASPTQSRAFRPYVFGKQNNAFVVRAGWGMKRYYSEKARQKGVAMGMTYSFGPALGLIKPYYLALSRPDPDNPGRGRAMHEKYTEANAAIFTDRYRILGASPFLKGIGETDITLGGSASVALHMDWGAFDEVVKALEIGVMLDAFAKPVPILVGDGNSRAFLNFFVGLQFGKRR